MSKIILDCTDYIKDLIDKKELSDIFLIYEKYIICLDGNENGIVTIYRI